MYDELITAIRKTACQFKECGMCPKGKEPCIDRYALQAADAIEGLSKLANAIPHKCECCIGCEIEQKNGGCDNGFALSPKRAMNYIKELSKPRWIPVTERLPDNEEKQYLVTIDSSFGVRYTTTAYYAKNLEEVGGYSLQGKRRGGFYGYIGVLGYCEMTGVRYWMPLPEPPKER